ncbi:MAG: hypothetical protein RL318_2927 [Fibrobacterota bacterium]|jgi:predicted transposase/invertase (TIGR01784 family)
MAPTRPKSAHDEFFKAIFTNVRHARDLLKGLLPTDISCQMDLSALELDQTSYVSESLKESCTDLVFRCPMQGAPAMVAILLEHKSWEPASPHLQLLRYMLSIWEQNLADGDPLRVVIPILIHQGERRWDVRPFVESFAGLPDSFRRFVPSFDLVYEDLFTTSAADLGTIFQDVVVQTALATMKYTSAKDDAGMLELAKGLSPELGGLPPDESVRTLHQLLEYIFKSNDTRLRDALIQLLHPNMKGSTVTIAESWIQEGIERGMEQGIEKGIRAKALEDAQKMLDRNCEWDFITEITGLKPEDLDANSPVRP